MTYRQERRYRQAMAGIIVATGLLGLTAGMFIAGLMILAR